MPKVLIFSDLHIHPHRNDSRRIEDGLECLKWIYQTAEIAGIKQVIGAGDFLHHRFSLNAYAYSKASNIVAEAKENGIETYLLLGNHDIYYEDRWDTHSLMPMQGTARIIDKPTSIWFGEDRVDFLPYTPTPSKFLPELLEGRSGYSGHGPKTLITHLAIADAVLNAKYDIKSIEDDSKDKEIISASAFAFWDKVWVGHYHYGQKVTPKVEYIGSPMQLSFGEAGQGKHIVIYDTHTGETQYVENTVSPKFHIVEDADAIPQEVTGSYIQMRTVAPLDGKFELRKHLSRLGAREIEFCPINNTQSVNIKAAQALSNISQFFHNKEKLIEQYIKGVNPEGFDVELLTKVGLHLISSLES